MLNLAQIFGGRYRRVTRIVLAAAGLISLQQPP
jgi:hypothetical protein